MRIFDVGIIGAGIAGSFAALRLAEKHKDVKAVLIEFGRPPGKRRRQLEGWFGCFPTGDGKVYPDDIKKVLQIADGRRAKAIDKWFHAHLDSVFPAQEIKTKQPKPVVLKRIKQAGFDIETRSYKQWVPKNIHQLSSIVADQVESAGNVKFSFDNEVFGIQKQHGVFVINTAKGEFKCRKVVLCSGRSGWRWTNNLYRKMNILVEDEYAMYGIRVELPAQSIRDFNKSHCTLTRPDLTVGPFNWGGSIIQEDHADLTIAAFRSNEDRWRSEKSFFSIIGKIPFETYGWSETDRVSKEAFTLSGDRVGRDKITNLLKRYKQVLARVPMTWDPTLIDVVWDKAYQWIPNVLDELNVVIPNLISRGYFHCPDITPYAGKIHLSSKMETEIDGLFVAGENAGIIGIAAAGVSGALAVEGALK